jgi:hypothetical protein
VEGNVTVPKWAPIFVAVIPIFGSAADAAAQSLGPPSRLAWDTSVMTGLFVGHPADVAPGDHFDDWYHSGTLAITAGRYLTRHLKAESEITLSREGKRYFHQIVQVPGVGAVPVAGEQMVRTNGVSANLVWQFLDNQWVHPFVFGGAALDFDRTRVRARQQFYYRGDPRVPGNQIAVSTDRTDHLGTTKRARGIIGTGVKIYMSPRAFVRTDARVGVGGDDSGHVAFRFGFGVDF